MLFPRLLLQFRHIFSDWSEANPSLHYRAFLIAAHTRWRIYDLQMLSYRKQRFRNGLSSRVLTKTPSTDFRALSLQFFCRKRSCGRAFSLNWEQNYAWCSSQICPNNPKPLSLVLFHFCGFSHVLSVLHNFSEHGKNITCPTHDNFNRRFPCNKFTVNKFQIQTFFQIRTFHSPYIQVADIAISLEETSFFN